MKCCFKLVFSLIVFAVLAIPLVQAASLNPYPDTMVRFTAYGTYLMLTQTLAFDSLTVNSTDANFANVQMGSGSVRSQLDISVSNGNFSLTELAVNNVTEFVASGIVGTNCTVLLSGWPTHPSKVMFDGVEKTYGDCWTYSVPTLNFTVPFASSTNSTVSLDWTVPSGGGGTQGSASSCFVTFIVVNGTVPVTNAFVIVNCPSYTLTYHTDYNGNASGFYLQPGTYSFSVAVGNAMVKNGSVTVTKSQSFTVDIASNASTLPPNNVTPENTTASDYLTDLWNKNQASIITVVVGLLFLIALYSVRNKKVKVKL